MNLNPTFHIFGSSGLLGSALCLECKSKNKSVIKYSFSGADSIKIDICDFSNLNNISHPNPGDYIINLAAIAQPQKVYQDKLKAYAVNVGGSENLATFAEERGCKYFLMSSVEVFGRDLTILTESDKPQPINEYGRQKLEAEINTMNHDQLKSVVARTSWNVSMNGIGRCLVDVMIDSLSSKNARMAVDNYFTIASSKETAANIIKCLESDFHGIVHIASPSPISRFDIADTIVKASRLNNLHFSPCHFSDLEISSHRSRLNILDTKLSILKFNAKYSDPRSIIIEKVIKMNHG